MGGDTAAKALTATVAAAVAAAVAEFAPLEREILRIFQAQDIAFDDKLFTEITSQVISVADEVGLRAQDIGTAIATGVGKGFDQEFSTQLAEVAGNIAVATNSEVAPSIAALTGVVGAYGSTAEDVAHVSEALFETFTFANVPMNELARQLGNITPSAAGLGVTLEEVGAAVGAMTSQGLTVAETTTQLRTLFTELAQSGSKGSKVFKAISGKTFPEFIKQGGSLKDALSLIRTASDQANVPVQDLFGNVNSGNAVIALSNNNLKLYSERLQRTAKDTGSLSTAVDSANTGTLRTLEATLNRARNALDRLALAFRPLQKAIEDQLVGGAAGIIGVFDNISLKLSQIDWTQFVAQATAVLRPFGQLIMSVFSAIAGLDWGAIMQAIMAAAAPVGALILGLSKAAGLLAQVIDSVVAPALSKISSLLGPLSPVIAAVVGGLLAMKVAFVGLGVLGTVVKGFTGLFKLVTKLIPAMKALWTIMQANPFFAIVGAIAAISIGLKYAWDNFEAFRVGVGHVGNFIIDVINKIVWGFLQGVRGMYEYFRNVFAEPILVVIGGIARAWSKLPKLFGGGKADGAADAIAALRRDLANLGNDIDALSQKAQIAKINIDALRDAEQGGVVMSRAGQLPPGALLAQKRAASAAGPKINTNLPMPNLSALDDVLNPKKETKDSLAAAKKRLTKMIPDLFKATQKAMKGIGKKSIDAIDSTFDSLIGKYRDAIEVALEVGNKTVANRLKATVKNLQKVEKQLLKLAKRRDKKMEALSTAKDDLESLRKESESFYDSVYKSFVTIGSVAEASAGIGVTFRGIRNNLKDAVRTTRLFGETFAQLQKMGLNETSLRQLAEAGPAALDQARALARSGASGIKEINSLQNELDKFAGQNATNLTEEFFQAGINAGEALVKGLKSQKDAIIKEMESIANGVVKAAKKTLKIKSPSKVFDEIGRDTAGGMAQGVRRGAPDVAAAIQALASGGVNFGPGSIEINGVSDPAAARRAGILAGQAVASVLERNRAKAQMAGVGVL